MAKRARGTECWLHGMAGENQTTTNGPSYLPSHWASNGGRRVRRSQTGKGVFKTCWQTHDSDVIAGIRARWKGFWCHIIAGRAVWTAAAVKESDFTLVAVLFLHPFYAPDGIS